MISPLKTTQKTYLIIHLSFIFTAIIWHFFAPYAHNIIQKKQVRHAYLELVGDPATLSLVPETQATTQANQNKIFQTEWAKLPEWERTEIQNIMISLETELANSFWRNALDELYTWITFAPLLEKIGLLLSLLIPILVLLDIEGARATLPLLPLLALVYIGWTLSLPQTPLTHYEKLFPTEQEIISTYLKAPLSKNIFQQKEELQAGWDLYLKERYKASSPEFHFTKDKLYALWLDCSKCQDKPNHIPLWPLMGYFAFTICLCISLRDSKRAKPRLFTSGKQS